MHTSLSFATALLLGFTLAVGSSSTLQAQPQPATKVPPPAQPAPAPSSSDAAIVQYRAAVAFHNKQQYDFAVEDWERFLEKFPTDPLAPKARHYAGVCYLQLKQFDKAIAAFEQVTTKHPKFELLEASLTNLGLSYFEAAKAGKPELHAKSAATFDALLTQFPKSTQAPVALYYQAEALYNAGQREDAIRSYQQLVDKHPQATQRADALYALAVTLQELDQQDRAGTAYDLFLKDYAKHPLSTEVFMRRGDVLLANKKYSEAEKQFASAAAVKDFKLADYATLRQALAQYEQKKYADAAATYAALVNKFPQSEHARAATLSAGNCYYLANQHAEARTWLTKVIADGGDNSIEAAHWTARSYLKENQPAKALEVIEPVIVKNDTAADKSPSLHLLKLDQADAVYELSDRRKQSVTMYADLAKQFADSPSAPQALYMAGFAALNVGQYDDANKYAADFQKQHTDHALSPDVKFVAAESLLQLGKPAEAEKLYAELIEKYPTRGADVEQWQVRRALSLYLQKRYDDVIKQLGTLVAKFKQPAAVAEARYLLGSSQFELKQYSDAAQSFTASIAADTKWRQADEALLGLSRAQRATNDIAAARSSIERLLKDYPNSNLLDRAHFRLGEYQFAAGDHKAAVAEYQWVLDRTPDSTLAPHALYGMGLAQLSQQDYAAAESSFSSVLDKHAGHALVARAQNARASARLQNKDLKGALADANAYLKAEPDGVERSDARFVIGLAQVGDNKLDDAMQTFETILKDDPKYVGADKVLFELGWAAKNASNEPAAAAAFKRLADEYGDSPLAAESQYLVGEQQYTAKEYKQAAASYEAVLKKSAKSNADLSEKAQHKLAWALYQQNDFEGSERAFSKQLADHPQGALAADATFMQAESLFKLAKYDAAAAAFEKALLLKPSSPDFVTLGLLHAGQAAAQRKKWDDSLKLLARLTTDHVDSPWVPEALYEQGWAHQNRGRLDEAMKLYEAAVEKAPSREVGAPRARFMIGEVLFEQGNHRDAVRSFFKVAYGFDANSPEAIKVWQANATYESARCFEVLKDIAQAKKLYAELMEKYPTSDKSDLAKQRLAALAKG